MRKWQKKTLILVLAALSALLLCAAAMAEETPKETASPAIPALELPALENGTIVEIPVDQNSMETSIAPKEDCYLYEEGAENPYGYADPSITVNIGTGRIYDTNYMYARVKIASPSQLRTLMASSLRSSHTTPGHDLAKRVQAVIAINGDYGGGEDFVSTTLMRQGEFLRRKSNGKTDVLVIDKAGDFHILLQATNEDVDAIADQAVNIFTFGPALVADGEPQEIDRIGRYASHKPAQRTAFCQTGPLEYLLVATEGPENKATNSKGLTLEQLVDLVASFPGVQNAYNLDGGSSSTMVFRLNGKNWQKVNSLSSSKVRPLKDIIYFATAWEE